MRPVTRLLVAALAVTALLAPRTPSIAQDTWSVVSPYVVWITSTSRRGISAGSGVIMAGGLILTAAHVIDPDRTAVSVGRQGSTLSSGTPARVLHVDRRADVAVLTAPVGQHGLLLAEFGPSSGDELWAFGYEFRAGHTPILRMARATVGQRFSNFYQVDGAFQKGFSGGPLVTRGGKVAGILSFSTRQNTNLAYMVPSGRLVDFLFVQLPDHTTRPGQPARPEQPAQDHTLQIHPGSSIGPIVLRRTTRQDARASLGRENRCTSIPDRKACLYILTGKHSAAPESQRGFPWMIVLFEEASGTAQEAATNSTAFTLRNTRVRLGDPARSWTQALGEPDTITQGSIEPIPRSMTYHWLSQGISVAVAESGNTVLANIYPP
jgi:hypothetical protein